MPAFLSKILRVCSIGIFLYLCYLRITKVWSMLHHGSVGWVQGKECSFFVHIYFFGIFLLFLYQKSCAVIIFITFFLLLTKFLQQNINQSETEIGNKKLAVELHVNILSHSAGFPHCSEQLFETTTAGICFTIVSLINFD